MEHVPSVEYEAMRRRESAEPSSAVRARVNAARSIQHARFAGTKTQSNARMSPAQLQKICQLDDECAALMKAAFDTMGLNARSYDRILKVARTIADLDGEAQILPRHLAEAIQYRTYRIGRS